MFFKTDSQTEMCTFAFYHFGACRSCSSCSLILTLLWNKTCSFSRCQLNDARFARVFLLCGGISKGRTKKCTWNWSQDTCLGASLFSICLGMPIMSIWKRQVIHRPLASTNWANCCCFWFCLHIARTPQGAQGFHAVTGDTHKSSKIFSTSQPPPSSPPFFSQLSARWKTGCEMQIVVSTLGFIPPKNLTILSLFTCFRAKNASEASVI